MICTTVSSWSCFCLLYRASLSLAVKNIIKIGIQCFFLHLSCFGTLIGTSICRQHFLSFTVLSLYVFVLLSPSPYGKSTCHSGEGLLLVFLLSLRDNSEPGLYITCKLVMNDKLYHVLVNDCFSYNVREIYYTKLG